MRRRPGSAHTVPRMEIQGQGKKSNISPLGENLKYTTSGFSLGAKRGRETKRGLFVRGEREEKKE